MNTVSLATVMQAGYRSVLRPLLFRLDPERVHDTFLRTGKLLGRTKIIRLAKPVLARQQPILNLKVAGIPFSSPIGLAAGFDKNAELLDVLPYLGLGFAEIGSITKRAYAGNTGKRLTRAPELGGIFVNYGLKSDGAQAVRERISKNRPHPATFPIGISIAPTNDGEAQTVEKMIEEYIWGIEFFKANGSYLTLNLSCPNTACGQPFLEPENLALLLKRIPDEPLPPIFLKLSPDLPQEKIHALLDTAAHCAAISGLVLSNLTKDRSALPPMGKYQDAPGGLSGKILYPKTLRIIQSTRKRHGERFNLIACGGIQSVDDVYATLEAGADLIQMVTGLIYNGPSSVAVLNHDLAKLFHAKGDPRVKRLLSNED